MRGSAGRAPATAAWCPAAATTVGASTCDLHPRAGVAAVVHAVVDEPGVAAQRDPAAGGVEVGLGGDRVLPVGELVGDVGQQLDERHADVGGDALGPPRREQAIRSSMSRRKPW